MSDDDEAREKLRVISAERARQAQEAEEKKNAEDAAESRFHQTVDAIFGPIFQAKAAALSDTGAPARIGERAIFYLNCTLYYKPLWRNVLYEVSGESVFEHQRHMTLGNYVYVGLIENVLDHRVMDRVDRDVEGLYLRQIAREEPYWGRVTRREMVTDARQGEGTMDETRRTDFPVQPMIETTEVIVQRLVESMARRAV